MQAARCALVPRCALAQVGMLRALCPRPGGSDAAGGENPRGTRSQGWQGQGFSRGTRRGNDLPNSKQSSRSQEGREPALPLACALGPPPHAPRHSKGGRRHPLGPPLLTGGRGRGKRGSQDGFHPQEQGPFPGTLRWEALPNPSSPHEGEERRNSRTSPLTPLV